MLNKKIYVVIANGELLKKKGSSQRGYALFVNPTEAQKCANQHRNPSPYSGPARPTAAVYEVTGLTPLEEVQ